MLGKLLGTRCSTVSVWGTSVFVDLIKGSRKENLKSVDLLKDLVWNKLSGCQSGNLFKRYLTADTEQSFLCVLRYLNHVRAAMPQDTAGGYTSALACYRAIQDAFSGMFPQKGWSHPKPFQWEIGWNGL